MGDKNAARITMQKAGVPVIPGCELIKDVSQAKAEAEKIGYPVMLKARSGGGGRGIRIIKSESEMETAFLSAAAEARSAFGDGEVYLEKYLSPVKHIEVQFICDNYGNVVCLGERECSVQRKNQKIIEESPSPFVRLKSGKHYMKRPGRP
jgi:acetyl-CoA carboxylase biotin carboxylase subunit